MERRSSLSAREVDELEDHLRARIELELELDAGLVPARAFAVARDDIGEATTLSREFARAGTPRWRKLLVAGWAMFAVSWFLPTLVESRPVPVAPDLTFVPNVISGWEAFGWALDGWGGARGLRQCTYQRADARDRSLGVPQTGVESALGRPPHGRRSSSQCAVLAVLGHERRRHGPATRLRGVGGVLHPGGHRPLATCARMGLRPA